MAGYEAFLLELKIRAAQQAAFTNLILNRQRDGNYEVERHHLHWWNEEVARVEKQLYRCPVQRKIKLDQDLMRPAARLTDPLPSAPAERAAGSLCASPSLLLPTHSPGLIQPERKAEPHQGAVTPPPKGALASFFVEETPEKIQHPRPRSSRSALQEKDAALRALNKLRWQFAIARVAANSHKDRLRTLKQALEEICRCPIAHQPMKSPVLGSDGCTYEEPYIREWLGNHSTSPITGGHLDQSHLQRNGSVVALLQLLEKEWPQKDAQEDGGSNHGSTEASEEDASDVAAVEHSEDEWEIQSLSDDEDEKNCEQIRLRTPYVASRRLGKGAFGRVYLTRDSTGTQLAAKVQVSAPAGSNLPRLEDEASMLRMVNDCPGFVKLVGFFPGDIEIMVMGLCGMSLESWRGFRRLTVPSCLSIARQVFAAIAHLHRHGFLHRDVKGDNLLLGRGQVYSVVLADLGLAGRIPLHEQRRRGCLEGTAQYCGRHAHRFVQARRDDAQALVFTVAHLSKGLPWETLTKEPLIYAEKVKTEPAALLPDFPGPFISLAEEINGLAFEAIPDFPKYQETLVDLLGPEPAPLMLERS